MANFLLDRSQFEIEDNWHVAGLCGTGSKRVLVSDIFVPAERVSASLMDGSASAKREGKGHSRRESDGLPATSVATLGLTGVPLGIASGALDRFRMRLAGKLRVTASKTAEQQIGAQLRYAESAAEVDAAELLVRRDFAEMTEIARAGREATLLQRGRYRRDAAWVIQTCARATARLAPAAGGHAVFLDDPMQRAVRDIQVVASHVVADWDASGESFARAALGLPKLDPLV